MYALATFLIQIERCTNKFEGERGVLSIKMGRMLKREGSTKYCEAKVISRLGSVDTREEYASERGGTPPCRKEEHIHRFEEKE